MGRARWGIVWEVTRLSANASNSAQLQKIDLATCLTDSFFSHLGTSKRCLFETSFSENLQEIIFGTSFLDF